MSGNTVACHNCWKGGATGMQQGEASDGFKTSYSVGSNLPLPLKVQNVSSAEIEKACKRWMKERMGEGSKNTGAAHVT